MNDKIKLNYPQMEEMAKHLDEVKQRLQQTIQLGTHCGTRNARRSHGG